MHYKNIQQTSTSTNACSARSMNPRLLCSRPIPRTIHSSVRHSIGLQYRGSIIDSKQATYRHTVRHSSSNNNHTPTPPKMQRLRATFMRGGTSNGLVLHRRDLPADPAAWQPILAAAMGSPDRYGRQLDGMGSGVSSTSKVCVVSRSERADADLDYTFVQVGIKDGKIDMAGNCGNLSAAVGPFGWDEGLLPRREFYDVHGRGTEGKEDGTVEVRIFNTNTAKVIRARFHVTPDDDEHAYDPLGTYSIDGVPGTASRITLSFLDPAGAKTGRALPTGNPIDALSLPDGSTIRASLLDIANPGVFVLAADLGIPGNIAPGELEARRDVMARLEDIRRAGTARMGLDPDVQSVPKIVILSPPPAPQTAQGNAAAPAVHIVSRALSMQQPHKAVPLTLGLNLGTACRIPGTLPALTARGVSGVGEEGAGRVTIAHASGNVEVGSVFGPDGSIESAQLHRTARVLMKGEVYYAPAAVGNSA